MKNKLKFLVGVSLKKKLKTKWFVIANVLLCLGIVAAFNIDSIIKFFGGDFDNPTEIIVKDEANILPIFKEQMISIDKAYYGEDSTSFKVDSYKNDKTIEEVVEGNDKKIVIEVKEDLDKVLNATITSNGFIDSVDYQLIQTALNNTKTYVAIEKTKIDQNELSKLTSPIEIERVILDENKKTEDENMGIVMSTIFPIFILPFFMLTVFLIQMIGAEVNDEKTTRGMEIIISNVSPKTHFASKILAGNIFVIFQGILLILYACIGFMTRSLIETNSIFSGIPTVLSDMLSGIFESNFIHQLIYIIPLALVLMVVTFVSYSLLAGILASVTTSQEDFQQLQSPIMVILFVGYYLAIMASTFDGSIFIRVLSYVPLISAILSPSLLVIGQIGVIDVIISTGIALVFNHLLIKYGLRIYKVGILNYSSTGLWKKMFKALKKKDNM